MAVTIYAADRHIVRQFAVGYQPASFYESRAKAAYWDRKNAFGESVSSGVYFDTLTAGDFYGTRKMLIMK